MPRHIGIILDGNRRYARKYGATDPHQIYELGARKLDDVLGWCCELRIQPSRFGRSLSRRSAAEVSGILTAVEAKMSALAQDPHIHQQRVRVKAAGRLEMLPAATIAAIRTAEEATATYHDGLALTIAVAYGGHDEITDAIRALLREAANEGKALVDAIEAVTPAAIARHLYIASLPDPDLIIRTSGENIPASCFGRAPIVSCTSQTSTGLLSARSTSYARSAHSSNANVLHLAASCPRVPASCSLASRASEGPNCLCPISSWHDV